MSKQDQSKTKQTQTKTQTKTETETKTETQTKTQTKTHTKTECKEKSLTGGKGNYDTKVIQYFLAIKLFYYKFTK